MGIVTAFYNNTRFHSFPDCKELKKVDELFIHTMSKELAKELRIFSCEFCKERDKNRKLAKIDIE